MRQSSAILRFRTDGRGLMDISEDISAWIRQTGIADGLLTLFCRHTSASLLVQENAAPEVRHDLLAWLERIAPESDRYSHRDEGPDDMPAHLRTALTGVNLSIPIIGGRMQLGTWQGIYLAEHRSAPHDREIALHVFGD